MQRTQRCLRLASDARAQLASHAPAAQTLYPLPAQKRWRKPELRQNPLTWTTKKRGAQPPQRKTRSTSPVSKSICAYMALFGALADIVSRSGKVHTQGARPTHWLRLSSGLHAPRTSGTLCAWLVACRHYPETERQHDFDYQCKPMKTGFSKGLGLTRSRFMDTAASLFGCGRRNSADRGDHDNRRRRRRFFGVCFGHN